MSYITNNFSEYTAENTFRVADYGGEVVLAHWKAGYAKTSGEPYGFWEYFGVQRESEGVGAYGKRRSIVRFSETTPSNLAAFVPPAPRRPAVVAAAKNELPFRVCDESRAERDRLLAEGYSKNTIVEILTKKYPPVEENSVLDF